MADDRSGIGGSIRGALETDKRLLGVIYIYLVAVMISSSWFVTVMGFETRLQQLGVAAALGVFWTVYYALAIHPKVLGYATEDED